MVPPRGIWGGRDPMGLLEVKVREGCDQRRDQFSLRIWAIHVRHRRVATFVVVGNESD
jgi:hypothetical protein